MIFISTGGFKSEKSINSINKLMEKGIYDIELSGGEYEVDQIEKIITEKNCIIHLTYKCITISRRHEVHLYLIWVH